MKKLFAIEYGSQKRDQQSCRQETLTIPSTVVCFSITTPLVKDPFKKQKIQTGLLKVAKDKISIQHKK